MKNYSKINQPYNVTTNFLIYLIGLSLLFSCTKSDNSSNSIKYTTHRSIDNSAFQSDAIDTKLKEFQGFIQKQKNLLDLYKSKIETVNQLENDLDCFNPDYPSDDQWCDPTLYYKTYTVIYHGCPMEVTMSFYWCLDLNSGQFYMVTGEIINNNIPWTHSACSNLLGVLIDFYQNAQWDELGDFIDDMRYHLEIGWEDAFVKEYIVSNTHQTHFCDTGIPTLIVENFKGSCYQYCIEMVDGEFKWRKVRCGSGCCKRTTTYCIDRSTNKLIKTEIVEPIKECTWDQEPPNCSGILTDCKETCSKIN